RLSGSQVEVGGQRSTSMLPGERTIDPRIEEFRDASRLENLGAVLALGDDRGPKAGRARRLDIADCSFVRLHPLLPEQFDQDLALALDERANRRLGQRDAAGVEERADVLQGRLAVE